MQTRTSTRSMTMHLVTLAAVLAATGCRGNTSELPPVHVFHNMDHQQRVDAQDPSEVFADGRGMRLPVAGTIAWGRDAKSPDPDFLKADDHYYRGYSGSGDTRKYFDTLPSQVQLDAGTLARVIECAQSFA